MSSMDPLKNLDELTNLVVQQCLQNRKTITDQRLLHVLPAGAIEQIKAIARPAKEPTDSRQVLEEAQQVYEYRARLEHPRFLSFVPGPASHISWLGEVLNSGYNPFAGSWMGGSGPSAVESTLISWLAETIGLPSSAGGCFVSGGTIANMTAIAVARDQKLSFEDRPRSVIYTSSQTHHCNAKSLIVLGFHPSQIREVECTAKNVMDVEKLEVAIEQDLEAGKLPFLVVATCGTTNTGSIDPLDAIKAIAQQHNLWLHVDGAYGASVALSTRHHHLAEGLRHCDSLSWDAHKWLFQTIGCGVVLVRQKSWLLNSFATTGEYLQDAFEGTMELPNFCNYSMELTRPARAMKLWFSLRMTGLDELGRMIDHGIDLAETAERELSVLPNWTIESPAQLAILCFRFVPSNGSLKETDEINQTISRRCLEANFAAIVTTRLNGYVVLRICSISPELGHEEMRMIIRGLDQIAQTLLLERQKSANGVHF